VPSGSITKVMAKVEKGTKWACSEHMKQDGTRGAWESL
jgi:hypothetical protein